MKKYTYRLFVEYRLEFPASIDKQELFEEAEALKDRLYDHDFPRGSLIDVTYEVKMSVDEVDVEEVK